MKEDNKNTQMLKEELWMRIIIVEVMVLKRITTIDKQEILEEIRRNGTKEQEVIQALEKNDRLSQKEDGIVYIEGRMYVPNNKKLKEKILQENYGSVDVGHPEHQRMLELIKQNYWWPELKEDIKKYVQGCFKCQQNKVLYQKKSGELYPLEISQGPWQKISIDIIGPLPRPNGMNIIVVIIDQFTKMIQLRVTTTSILSEEIAKIYRDNIWKLHRVLRKILSDQEPQFASKFMEEFMKVLETTRQLLIAYHS